MFPSSQKIKVLMAIPNVNGGGAEKIALDLAKAIDEERFEVTVFVHENQGSLAETLNPKVKLVFKNNKAYSRWDLIGIFFKNLMLAREADVLIGCNEGRATFLMLLSSFILRKPIVCWVHNNWQSFSKVTSWRQALSLRFYNFADSIVACSGGAGEAFRSFVRFSQNKIQRIFNGIPLQSIQLQAKEPIRREHEAIFQKPTVLSVGRLDYQKGQEYLVSAHALLLKKGIDHNLIILGTGPELEERKKQVAGLGVQDSVHFLGFQKNPYAYMRQTTVFALSSRFEGFGLVVAEALACGAPVVSVDCPSGPREILDDGACGVLVSPEDSTALALGLERLLLDEDLRKTFSQLGVTRSKDFDFFDIVKDWELLLTDLASGHG